MAENIPATTAETTPATTTATSPAVPQADGPLLTSEGRTTIADTVVSKIAGIAAREVNGVHDLGGSAARTVGALRERIPGSSTNLSQGISVEVGERQAAIEIDLVATTASRWPIWLPAYAERDRLDRADDRARGRRGQRDHQRRPPRGRGRRERGGRQPCPVTPPPAGVPR